jgi:hypothetical protein
LPQKCYASTVRFPRCGPRLLIEACGTKHLHRVSATIARGKRPVPSRTRKLSLSAPMVLRGPLRGRVGRRRTHFRPRSFGLCRTTLVGLQPGSFGVSRSILALFLTGESGWKTWRTTEVGAADRTQDHVAVGRAEPRARVVAVVPPPALDVVAPEPRGAAPVHRAVAAAPALPVSVVSAARAAVARPNPVIVLPHPLHAADSLRARVPRSPAVARPAGMAPDPRAAVRIEATTPARVAAVLPTTDTAPHRPLCATQDRGLLVRLQDRAA